MTNPAYPHIEQLPYILQILAQRCVDQLIAATDDPATHNPDLVGKLQRNLSGILRNLTLVERLTKSPDTVKESKQKTPPAITPAPQEEPEQPIEPQPALPPELPIEPQPTTPVPQSITITPEKPRPTPTKIPKPPAAPPSYHAKFPPAPPKKKYRQTKGAFGISKFRRQNKKP